MGDLNFINPKKPEDLLGKKEKQEKIEKPVKPVKLDKADKKETGKKEATIQEAPKNSAPLFGVNLMSQEALKNVARTHQKKNLVILGSGVLAAIALSALLFVGIRLYAYVIAQNARQLSVNLGKIDEEITAIERNAPALNKFQNKLATLKSLLEGHIYWSQFITELEKYTLPTVSYDTLSVAPGSAMSFSATAPDFRTLARQLLILQEAKSLVQDVRITAGSAQLDQSGDINGVGFEVSFTMNPNVLKKATP